MKLRLCERCGCRINNTNPRVTLCPHCHPAGERVRNRRTEDKNAYWHERDEQWDGPIKKKHEPL